MRRVALPLALVVAAGSVPIGCAASPSAVATHDVELRLDVIPWRQCIATVRGALADVDGVTEVMIREPIPDFTVTYDPMQTDVDEILAALADAGEPARRK